MDTYSFEKNTIKILFLFFLLLSFSHLLYATTPNPGHPWSEVGDGTFAVSGPTASRTYTFPDANATVLTTNSAVTVAQGGTGATTLTGILKGNGTSAVTAVTAPSGALVGDTDTQTLTNKTISKASNTLTGVAGSGANSDITSLSALSTPLSIAQGGTGVASLTANNLLLGNGTSAVSFIAPGTSGNRLQSDGTTWASTAQETITTITTRNYTTSGSTASTSIASLTTRNVGLFYIPARITINQLSYNVAASTTAGTYKVCVYTEDGSSKVIDVTSGTTTTGVNNITVSPAVTLDPGNYYVAMGCATTCSNTITSLSNISILHLNGASVPSGKRAYGGTVTHTSGTCNSTLGTVTAATTAIPLVRFDN
jgi:hypothetical protein